MQETIITTEEPETTIDDAGHPLKKMREELAESKLGHLGRRVQMLKEAADATVKTYGGKRFVAKLAGQEVHLPVKTTITQTVRIECEDVVKEYTFVSTSE